MAKQAEQRRMMGALLSRSFTIQQPELSATESIALECLKQIASEGRVADQYEIAAAIGSKNVNGGTMAGIVNRLIYPTDCPHCEAKRGKPCVDGGKPAERHLGRHLGWV